MQLQVSDPTSIAPGSGDEKETFTAKAAGAMTDATAAQFPDTYTGGDAVDDGITAVVTITEPGADEIPQVGDAAVTVEVTTVEASAGLDYLDFTAYDVKAVYVNGTVFDFGTAPVANADTGKYITMVESATNDGAYTISLLDLGATAATTDNVTTLIGVADFGVEQPFVTDNFII
jgi:hypothetical protein